MQQSFGLGRVFLPRRLAGVAIAPLNDPFEVHQMPSEQLDTWAEQSRQEGLEPVPEQGYRETPVILSAG